MDEAETLDVVREAVVWFEPAPDGFGPLLEMIGDASLVLIGEASHGTHEFYRTRAELTKALILGKRFNVVAVEADWPDAYRANRWVRHASEEPDAESALGDFTRFPRWMWRNRDVIAFLEWLHGHNGAQDAASRVGFYGLDLYSLHTSIEAVLSYLRKVDPAAAERARYRYGCFEDFGEDSQAYGYAAAIGLSRSCENDAVAQLVDLRRHFDEGKFVGQADEREPELFRLVDQRRGHRGEGASAEFDDEGGGASFADLAEVSTLITCRAADSEPGGEQHFAAG